MSVPLRNARPFEKPARVPAKTGRDGEVLLAYAGGEVRAALSVESGRVVADPFWPSAELVELLRAAAGDRPRRGLRRRLVRPALA